MHSPVTKANLYGQMLQKLAQEHGSTPKQLRERCAAAQNNIRDILTDTVSDSGDEDVRAIWWAFNTFVEQTLGKDDELNQQVLTCYFTDELMTFNEQTFNDRSAR